MSAERNRWWIVFASVLGLFVGNGPIMQFTFGVLLPPVAREFGWARGTVSSAIVVGLWMTGIATPLVGRLVDRFGVRAVALPAIALFSAVTASVALVPASPLVFTALYAVMGLTAAGQTPLVYAKAISARFDDRRGLALGIAMAGVGLGAAIVPLLAQAWIRTVGWRGAYVGLGGLTFILAFPAVAVFLGGRSAHPTQGDDPAASAAIEIPGLTAREAIRTRRFWRMAAAFVIVAAAAGGSIAHMVPLLTDHGVPASTATAVLSAAGLALVAGRLLAGYLLDRIFAPYVAVAFFLAPLAGILLLFFGPGPSVAAIATVLVGVGLGAEVDLIAFLLSRYFGMRAFGEIYGYLFALFMLGAGAGPFAMGVSYDVTGSYQWMLACFAIALVLASGLMMGLGSYVYPAGPSSSRHEPRRRAGLPVRSSVDR
jgi:MFS family permease